MNPSRSEFAHINGLRIHVRRWGKPGAPRIFFLHGLMDCSATFQFVIDAFQKEWDVIAPDLRGMGLSQWQHDSYWSQDEIADLDRLLEIYSQDEPANLIGHSKGASLCSVFAGIRPTRVKRLVFLDGYGIAPEDLEARPHHMADWLEAKRNGVRPNRRYADRLEFARRLINANPRLSQEQADFLAIHVTSQDTAGGITVAMDPWHRVVLPMVITHIEDYKQIWRRVAAPLLWVVGAESGVYARFATRRDDYQARLDCFHDVREVVVQNAGHNLHHDQPQVIAALIEQFVTS